MKNMIGVITKNEILSLYRYSNHFIYNYDKDYLKSEYPYVVYDDIRGDFFIRKVLPECAPHVEGDFICIISSDFLSKLLSFRREQRLSKLGI